MLCLAGIENGLQGMIQYQWGQQNLTTEPGTTVSPNVNGTTESPNDTTIGQSPNDGYSTTAECVSYSGVVFTVTDAHNCQCWIGELSRCPEYPEYSFERSSSNRTTHLNQT